MAMQIFEVLVPFQNGHVNGSNRLLVMAEGKADALLRVVAAFPEFRMRASTAESLGVLIGVDKPEVTELKLTSIKEHWVER